MTGFIFFNEHVCEQRRKKKDEEKERRSRSDNRKRSAPPLGHFLNWAHFTKAGLLRALRVVMLNAIGRKGIKG